MLKDEQSKSKGFVEILNNSIPNLNDRSFLMVLDSETLTLFKITKKNEICAVINISNCKLKNMDRKSSKICFRLYHPENRDLMKGCKNVDMKFESSDMAELWKAIFLSRGVIHDEIEINEMGIEEEDLTAELVVKIEKIRKYVERYMKIVLTNIQDISVKICVFLMIQKVHNFIKEDMLLQIYSRVEEEHLLLIDEDNKNILEKNKKLYSSLKQALVVIDEHILNTPPTVRQRLRSSNSPNKSNLLSPTATFNCKSADDMRLPNPDESLKNMESNHPVSKTPPITPRNKRNVSATSIFRG